MTVVSRTDRCMCFCHVRHSDTSYKYGVDTRSYLALILACDSCRRIHEPAFHNGFDDEPPSRPLPSGDSYTAWNPNDTAED